jgi:SanA protein
MVTEKTEPYFIEKILRSNAVKIAIMSVSILFLAILSLNLYIKDFSSSYIYDSAGNIPQADAVLILGASVFSDGRLSDILKDRVITAIRVYDSGKAPKILISGYSKGRNYNEVDSVKSYLLNQGIPESDIISDYSGFDTYDSLYRAKHIFKLDSIDITTQNYHLPRAIYVARKIGINAFGTNSDLQTYQKIFFFRLREGFANLKAVIDVLSRAKSERVD